MQSQQQFYHLHGESDIIRTTVGTWHEQLLKAPSPQSHFVQFYGAEDRFLTRNVGHFLAEGLKAGGALVIASQPHNLDFIREISEMGIDVDSAVGDGRLSLLDAQETLARFMVDGQPYWGRFEQTIGCAINEIRTKVGHGGLRAYGEMVGMLWSSGQFAAAIRLEQFWNKLLSHSSASLFCGYPIDILSPGFDASAVDAVLCAHTHVLPSGSNANLESAIRLAMHQLLGTVAGELETAMDESRQPTWAQMPKAEATVLWVRQNLPERADEIFARARQFLPSVSADPC